MSGQHLVGEEAVGYWQKENVTCPGLEPKTLRGKQELYLFVFIIKVKINKGQDLSLYLIANGFVIRYVITCEHEQNLSQQTEFGFFSHNGHQYRQQRL